jgi:salicylate hydroxylase
MPEPAPILIAGGGIGGLGLALALAGHGLASSVLEARAELAEAGAGIQIGPNGVHILRAIAVAERLAPLAGVPRAILVNHATSGRHLAELPLGAWIAHRHGAPYWTAHRADLHAALLEAARENGLVEIVPGFAIETFDVTGTGVTARSSDARTRSGAALIGADGLWSAVRERLIGPSVHAFAGKTATRTVIAASAMPALVDPGATGVWLAPDAHVVHYPVRAGAEIALVVICDEGWREPGWSGPADRAALLARMRGAAPALTAVLEAGEVWHKWALFDPQPLAAWSRGPVTLLGDAAHPILPFLAQGGVMALEDGLTLARELAASPDDPATACQRYERARRKRTARVQAASRRNGQIYHLAGAAAIARDLALGALPGRTVMSQLDWLYGWRPGDGAGAHARR